MAAAPMSTADLTTETDKRRFGCWWIVGIIAAVLMLSYCVLVLQPLPESFRSVTVGMSKVEATRLLKPNKYQIGDGFYGIQQWRGLRCWRIRVEFKDEAVSRIEIRSETPHQMAYEAFAYLWAYL